jgi:2,4-dienoyl-CoA reductase-like NADH-dependent reductase (Old Yellow Enzyme family)
VSALFTPLRLRETTLRNRIAVSPMCQYSARDGVPNEWHLVHLGSRAVGGAGLVIAEASAVRPEGRISPDDTGLWSDAQAEAWAPIARFIAEQGAVPAVQLAHAGRKASTEAPWHGGGPAGESARGWRPVGPSPLPFAEGHPVPRELTTDEITAIVGSFRDAARRAEQAGFEVVEIHMAHGYLLHQFLSPLTNRRTDEYGGTLENRMRLPLEVARAVREAFPVERPVLARISATDWVDGGWDIDQ